MTPWSQVTLPSTMLRRRSMVTLPPSCLLQASSTSAKISPPPRTSTTTCPRRRNWSTATTAAFTPSGAMKGSAAGAAEGGLHHAPGLHELGGGPVLGHRQRNGRGGRVEYRYDGGVYAKRCYEGFGKADPGAELRYGPNIKDWPHMPKLEEDLLVQLCAVIQTAFFTPGIYTQSPSS